jgi:micrococcal nuclease
MGLCSSKPATYENTPPFVPPITSGQVIKVYDGDTITIAATLYGKRYRFQVRLYGIDCPELKGPPEEKQKAIKARDALSARILHKTVTLKNVSTEKYGRLLAEVYLHHENLSSWLLAENHARPYFGGSKEPQSKLKD